MNLKNRLAKVFALTALVFSLLAVSSFGQTRVEPTQSEATFFGMHTMNTGQTMRLAVVNRKPLSDREIIPCIRVRIVVDIYEMDGSVRPVFVRRAERTLTLDAGEAVSFDLPSSRAGGERVNVSVFMSPEEQNPSEPIRLAATATLEMRESGKTIFNIPGVIKGFDPQPDPPH